MGRGGAGSGADAEVLGSASPFFKIKGQELKRVAVRYVGFPDAAGDSVKVKDAFAAFVGPCKRCTRELRWPKRRCRVTLCVES